MYKFHFEVQSRYNLFIFVSFLMMMGLAEKDFSDVCQSYQYCNCEETQFRHLSVNCKNLTNLDILPDLLKELKHKKIQSVELEITNCADSDLYVNVFQTINVEVIYMDCPFNYIDENTFNAPRAVTDLILDNLNFTSIPRAVGKAWNLRNLQLNFGQLLHIGDELHLLTKLDTLNLRRNKIETVSRDAFIKNRNIQNILLSFNRIRFFYPGTFRFCKNIRAFHIDNNRLETANGLPFRDSLGNIAEVLLDSNNLTTLPENTFPEKTAIIFMSLTDNPWVCDCRLLWLRKLYFTQLLSPPLECHQPEKFHGKQLNLLSEEDLMQSPNGCPSACNCTCVSENENFSIKVDCSARNLTELPVVFPDRTGELDLQDNFLTNRVNLDSAALSTLKILNLERNSITKLDFLPENISVVRLANNSITRFLRKPPPSVSLWTLAGNPWICDCDAVDGLNVIEFRAWMMKQNNKIADINATVCDPNGPSDYLNGKPIVYLTESDLCSYIIYFIIAFTILSFVIFGMSSAFVYRRYHYYIKVWLFSRGLTFLKKDMDQDDGKIYDAFVSAADEDFLIVKNFIIPELELKPSFYKLFEPRRDMKAGEMCEYEKELENILKSRRFIVLLSQNYINNNYLIQLFNFAFTSSFEEKVFRLILIIVGDLPPLSDDHLSLKAAMTSTRCLRLGEKMFQDMLLFSMPKKKVIKTPPSKC